MNDKTKRIVFKRIGDCYYYELKLVYDNIKNVDIWQLSIIENGKLKLQKDFDTIESGINYYLKNYN